MALIHCFCYVPDILHVASRLILQHEKLYYSHFIKEKKTQRSEISQLTSGRLSREGQVPWGSESSNSLIGPASTGCIETKAVWRRWGQQGFW